MIYLITYDLKQPGQDYKSLSDAIKKNAETWWHHLDSVWIIKTDSSTDEWVKYLRKYMDNNDFLLIVEICKNYNGWLPKNAWDWLNTVEGYRR